MPAALRPRKHNPQPQPETKTHPAPHPILDPRPGPSRAQAPRDPRHRPSPPIAPGSLHLQPRIHLPTPGIPPNKKPDPPRPGPGPGHLYKAQGPMSNKSVPKQVDRMSKHVNPSVFALSRAGTSSHPVPRMPLGIDAPGADIGPPVPASTARGSLRETEKGVTVS